MAENKTVNQNGLKSDKAKEMVEVANRFSTSIMNFYSEISNVKMEDIPDKEKQLISGYYVAIDNILKANKYSWNDVELDKLALQLAHQARLGLDMRMDNHIHAVPFKNKKDGTVTMNLITGYKGEQYKTMKFAREVPVDIRVELVHSTDCFEVLKKSKDNAVENYRFDIVNPFNRGEIIGGFGYIEYEDATKNKIIIMSKEDILKRKPKSAAVEFWGGEKKETVWDNAQRTYVETGKTTFVEGYPEKMYAKTIMKEVCKNIELDPEKIEKFRNTLNFIEHEEMVQDYNEIDEESKNKTANEAIDVDFENI